MSVDFGLRKSVDVRKMELLVKIGKKNANLLRRNMALRSITNDYDL